MNHKLKLQQKELPIISIDRLAILTLATMRDNALPFGIVKMAAISNYLILPVT